jgi:acyl-coenzyme A synthetase/AMP-(fatty) acid ligase
MPDGYFKNSINNNDNSVQSGTDPIAVTPGTSLVHITGGTTTTVTLPAAAASVGAIITVVNEGSGNATIATVAADTDPSVTTVATVTAGIFASNGVDAWFRVLIV